MEKGKITLDADEVKIVRKVLQLVNTLYTIAEPEYRENKIDVLLRKLRQAESEADNA